MKFHRSVVNRNGIAVDGLARFEQDRLDQIGFDVQNLERVLCNPGASFEFFRIDHFRRDIPTRADGPVFALNEMDDPCGRALPIGKALAAHVVVALIVRVENQRKRRETLVRRVAGERLRTRG